MFTHRRMQRALAFYRHLSLGERAAVDAHVQGCQDCSRRLRAYRAMDEALAALPTPGAPPALRPRFLNQIQAQKNAERASSARSLSLSRGLVLAGLALALLMFWGALRWMHLDMTPGPGVAVSSPQPRPLPPAPASGLTPVTNAILQEVPFRFDMAWCKFPSDAWRRDRLIDLQVDQVWLSVRDWDAHQSWRIEGTYHVAAGNFRLSVLPDFPSHSYFSITGRNDSLLREGDGDFVLAGHVSQGKAALPASITLLIFDREDNTRMEAASCPIHLKLPNGPASTPGADTMVFRQWTSDDSERERARALHYAPAVTEWIARRTWFTLPASVPWDFHHPLLDGVGSPSMGQAQFSYLTPRSAEQHLRLDWRRSAPKEWGQTTDFPQDFVRPLIDFTLPVTERMTPTSSVGSYEWEGEREIDGQRGKLWRRKLRGRPDEYWLLWRDAGADLTYVLIIDARDDDVLTAMLQGFHAENPAHVSAVQRDVMSWGAASPTWVPPWLTQDMKDLAFDFDPGQCRNPNAAAAPPIELTLTRLAVNNAEDGVLRWVLAGEYEFPAGDRPYVVLGLYPPEAIRTQDDLPSPFRTGKTLQPEYHHFVMLTEMRPPDDGSLPDEMILIIQTAPNAPGWQCPLTIGG